MKLKKLPGFSLGLIALAVGNAYATQLLDNYSIISYITDEESPIQIKDNTLISWICPYISRHLLSLNPLLACCRRYSRGER
ncbi:ATPase [Escherichia coli]